MRRIPAFLFLPMLLCSSLVAQTQTSVAPAEDSGLFARHRPGNDRRSSSFGMEPLSLVPIASPRLAEQEKSSCPRVRNSSTPLESF